MKRNFCKMSKQNKDKSVRQLIFFIISLIVCYMVAFSIANIMGTLLLKNYSQTLRDNVAMLLGMGLYTALNYIAQRFIVFKIKDKFKE